MLPLTPAIRFLTNPHFILTIIYFFFVFLFNKYRGKIGSISVTKDFSLAFEAVFLIAAFDLWLFNIPFQWYDLPPFILFLFVLSILSNLNTTKKFPTFLIGFLLSTMIGFLLVLIVQNDFSKDFSLHLILPNMTVSGYSYTMILYSLIFFLSGFLWMNYSHFLVSLFKKPEKAQLKTQELIITHIQLITMFIVPLFIAKEFGRTDLYEPFLNILLNLSVAQIYLIPYCMLLSLIGKKILKLKMILLLITGFSFLTVFSTIAIIYQYIISNTTAGSFAIGVIVSYLFTCCIGIILARKIECPHSTIMKNEIKFMFKEARKRIFKKN